MGEGRKHIILVAMYGRSPLGPSKLILAVVCLICLPVIPGLNLLWATSDNVRVVVFPHTFPLHQHNYLLISFTVK